MKTTTKLAALLLAGLATVTAPAFAFNEGSVNHADLARVSAEVAKIADATSRAQAQRKVYEAQSWIGDDNDYQAYVALKDALKIAGSPQVAELPQ